MNGVPHQVAQHNCNHFGGDFGVQFTFATKVYTDLAQTSEALQVGRCILNDGCERD